MSKNRAVPEKTLKWREKQPAQSIMKTSTFNKIKRKAAKKYGSEKKGEKTAGKSYWNTVKSKFKAANKQSKSK